MRKYIFILIATVLFGCKDQKKENYSISNYDGTLEKNEERIYKDSLDLVDQFILNGYSDLMETYKDEIYFIDYQKNKLLKYNAGGEQVGEFLKGSGDGPSELQQPIFMGFQDDNLHIFDRRALSIKTFTDLDFFNFENSVKVEKQWTKGAYIRNRDFVFTKLNKDNQLEFDFYNLETQKVELLDTLSSLFYPVSDADFIYDGFFETADDDIFYFMYANSSFVKFNQKGVDFVGKLIQEIPGPSVVKEGNSTYLNSNVTGVFDATIYEERIYVLSGIIYPSVDNGKISIDVYDRNNGEYIQSYMIPKVERQRELNPQHITFLGDELVVLYEESFVSIFNL